jgi:hypothetical protein
MRQFGQTAVSRIENTGSIGDIVPLKRGKSQLKVNKNLGEIAQANGGLVDEYAGGGG